MGRLAASRVAVFGIGGVGGYVVEALVRSGVGALDLIDDDKVCLTNLNRQIIATRKTVGKYKVDVAEERVYDINPDCQVRTYKTFYLPETQDQFDFTEYDYVVDAIDTVTGKIQLILQAAKGTDVKICVTTFYQEGANAHFDDGIKQWINSDSTAYHDAKGRPVDAGGYLLDLDGSRIRIPLLIHDVEDTDGVKGNEAILAKLAIIRQWFLDSWNIDLDALHREVQKRQHNYDINALRKQIDDVK